MTEDVRDKDVKGTGGEGEKFTFSKWYEENKESLAERRRKRYETDEEYRQKRILEARRFYSLKKRRAVSVKNRLDFDALGLEPDIVMDVKITNENDIRHGLVVPYLCITREVLPRCWAELFKRFGYGRCKIEYQKPRTEAHKTTVCLPKTRCVCMHETSIC